MASIRTDLLELELLELILILRRNELLPSWNDIGNEVMLILKNKDVKKWAKHQILVLSGWSHQV